MKITIIGHGVNSLCFAKILANNISHQIHMYQNKKYNKKCKSIYFHNNIKNAVINADYIQIFTNHLEKKIIKIILAQISIYVSDSTIIAFDSANISINWLTSNIKSQCIIINPIYQYNNLSLIEITPNKYTREIIIENAQKVFKSCSLSTMRTSTPIAEKLQTALMDASGDLMKKHSVSLEQINKILTSSLALKWVITGISNHENINNNKLKKFNRCIEGIKLIKKKLL